MARARVLTIGVNAGANSPTGIGRATAHRLARGGARAVYLCDVDDGHLAAQRRELAAAWPGVAGRRAGFAAFSDEFMAVVRTNALSYDAAPPLLFPRPPSSAVPAVFLACRGWGVWFGG